MGVNRSLWFRSGNNPFFFQFLPFGDFWRIVLSRYFRGYCTGNFREYFGKSFFIDFRLRVHR